MTQSTSIGIVSQGGGTSDRVPSRMRVSVADLVPGIYLARVETVAGASRSKFVVTRP